MTGEAPAFELRPVVLEGRHVRLEPISLDHVDALLAAGRDGAIWRWMPYHPRTRDDVRAIVEKQLTVQRHGDGLSWATVRLSSGDVIGSTSFLNVSAPDRRLEIGSTWLAPGAQRTPVNTEAKYLQLRHCFETLGCLRAVREGVFQHLTSNI